MSELMDETIEMKIIKGIRNCLKSPIFLIIWMIVAMSLPGAVLAFTEPVGLYGRIANLLFLLAVTFAVMCVSRRTGLMVWVLFPLMVINAFQIVLLNLYGRSIISVDMFLNLVTTNSSEAFELLNNLATALITIVVLYIPSLVSATTQLFSKIRLDPTVLKRLRKYMWIPIISAVIVIVASYLTCPLYSVKRDLYPLNVGYNVYLATERSKAVSNYYATSSGFRYNAERITNNSVPEVYILVVGETSRADNWQLYGYARETNPHLVTRERVIYYPLTLSESNTTHKSVPMLLSPVSGEDFENIYKYKSIITAFKEAGFHTVFLSNQCHDNSFIDFFANEADTVDFIREISGEKKDYNPYDISMIPKVKNLVEKAMEPTLIVIHTYGSHFCYRGRYSTELLTQRFVPDSPLPAKPSARRELVNAYDNTIMVTDIFLDSIASIIDTYPYSAAIIYTADHGEDLFDDNRKLFLHASTIPSFYQLRVPMLIIPNEKYVLSYPEKISAANSNRGKDVSSTLSYFHTALDMAGISTSYLDRKHSLSSDKYLPAARFYLDDHNQKCPLVYSGMRKKDFELLDSVGISYRQIN